MKDETIVAIIAIIGIVALECMALYMKIDGQIFSVVVGAIAAIAGYEIKAKQNGTKRNTSGT